MSQPGIDARYTHSRCYREIHTTASFHVQGASQVVKSSSPKVIDVASGAGEPGISLAKHFTSGNILITDIAPGMVEQAKKMCAGADVKNVRYKPSQHRVLALQISRMKHVVTQGMPALHMPSHATLHIVLKVFTTHLLSSRRLEAPRNPELVMEPHQSFILACSACVLAE